MKLAGGSTGARYKDRLNVDAFVAQVQTLTLESNPNPNPDPDPNPNPNQAAAYDEVAGASRTGRMVSRQMLAGATHPLPILRARELERWAASPEYARLLARGTPRRVAPSEVGAKAILVDLTLQVDLQFPITKGSWAKWALWGSPSSLETGILIPPHDSCDREGTLVRFSPSRRSRGSWLTLARILPRASGAVETADLRHRSPDPDAA
eukprot:scaffold195_cov57-Phaeocystis_antarctica.AAC.1